MTNFIPTISVAVGTLYFSLPSCHRLENRKCGTRTLSEASWLSTLEHQLHSSDVWPSIHFAAVAVSKNLTPSWGRPKAASFSEDICDITWHVLYVITMSCVSQHCLFNCKYIQHARNSMAKCIHPNTVVKIKNKNFSVLAWHGLYWYEVDAL